MTSAGITSSLSAESSFFALTKTISVTRDKPEASFGSAFAAFIRCIGSVLSLTLLKHHATPDHDGSYMHASSVIVSSYLLVHLFSYRTIMVQAWTLFDEVQFYLIFSLWIVNRRLGITALCVWLAASLLYITPFSVYWAVVFSPCHFLFALGILVALVLQANGA
jgi:hypothetical protein